MSEQAVAAPVSSNGARSGLRRYGQGYRLDERKVDGVTTVINTAFPKKALVQWAASNTAQFLIDRWEILEKLEPDERYDLARGAAFRDRDRAANRGTEVHRLAKELTGGGEVEVPEELIGHVDAYLAFREKWQPSEELIETSVASRQWRYAGTFDCHCRLRGLGETLLDIKTNRSGPFGETALQLAAYGHAEFYNGPDGDEVPMPPIDTYAVLWLRADGYDLYRYDVTEREWLVFRYLQQVAHWINTRERQVKGPALYEIPQEAIAS